MFDLTGKVALVTGGGRGIGRAIALALAGAGADVAVTARSAAQIESVAKEITARGRRALAVPYDAMSVESTRAAVAAVVAGLGTVHILVNNAGGIAFPRAADGLAAVTHEDEAFVDNLLLNLVSVQRASREVLPHMVAQRYGRIINIGSGYARRGGGLLAYSTAKHGVVGLTRAMAHEVALEGVTVNCLCPGWTNTSLVDYEVLGAAWGVDAATAKARIAADALQNRVLEPEELGPMAVLLASDAGYGITGQVLSVDGGFKV